MFRTLRRKIVRLAVVAGAGAAANYFFDRERGPQRRSEAKGKATGLLGRQSPKTDWQPSAAKGFEPQTPPGTVATPPAAPTAADITGHDAVVTASQATP